MIGDSIAGGHKSARSGADSKDPGSSSADGRLAGLTILVADDDDLSRELTLTLLATVGARSVGARNGREAVAAVASGQDELDAVLMDINMPVLDGLSATGEIRGLTQGADLPIIALTASAWDEERKAALSAGMNEYMDKSTGLDELVAVLLHWAGRKAQPGGADEDREAPAKGRAHPLGPPSGPVIDDEGALARFGGDAAFYREALARLPVRVESWRGELRAATGSADNVARVAHKIKGSTATLGAVSLSAAAAELEMAARQQAEPDVLASLIDAVNAAMTDAVAEARRRSE